MNVENLNEYIKHYIEEDKTNLAVMLSGPWGSGKSYYIQNDLIPFLSKGENGNHSCIVVSLYDLNDTAEISKIIYFESLINRFNKQNKATPYVKFAIKAIAKGITSFYGVDLSMSGEDFKKIYESIDLSGKLIILEDIERTEIDILKVLGYVNSLVEQSGVKVLIVANEDEILNHNNKYLKAKEKTIGDTIFFKNDLQSAVKEIMSSFGSDSLTSMSKDEKTINELFELLHGKRVIPNLRTLKYAFQKISDIFNRIDERDEEILKTIFFSIVNFTTMIKNGEFPNWSGTDLVSPDLGFANYPLYRFCYDYIRWQEFDKAEVKKAVEAHKNIILYNSRVNTNRDNDLKILFNYHIHTEKEVDTALDNIKSRLNDPADIPFYCYNKLAYYLVECGNLLNFDYRPCKERMIENLRTRKEYIDINYLIFDLFDFQNEKEKEEFTEFINEIKEEFEKPVNVLDFEYSPDKISELNQKVNQNLNLAINGHTFISKFDLKKLADMIFACDPSQLDDFRGILFSVYRTVPKGYFMESDIEFMRNLTEEINKRITKMKGNADKIIMLQINLLLDNLNQFINEPS